MTTPTVGRPATNDKNRKTSSGNRTRSRGYDARGSAEARRTRSTKLLSDPQFAHSTGTGWPGEKPTPPNVHCTHCGNMLTYERGGKNNTLEQDKINPSGTYKYENIQPSCRTCNISRSNDTSWKPLAGKIQLKQRQGIKGI
jgi:5-methylcytosine-specific restriction endonuclease McrA